VHSWLIEEMFMCARCTFTAATFATVAGLAALAVTSTGSEGALDHPCNLNGDVDHASGACVCDAAWSGSAACDVLAMDDVAVNDLG
jgi:hypothetical protein